MLTDAVFTLADGRRLGYSLIGNPSARPVVYLHGNPGSRMEVAFPAYQQAIEGANAFVISVDRPGYGDSDRPREPGHTPLVGDIEQLLNHLQLAQAAAVGLSRGAIPAIALGALLPNRFPAVGLLGPTGLPDFPDLLKVMLLGPRVTLGMTVRAPAVMKAAVRALGVLEAIVPGLEMFKMKAGNPSKPDQRVFRDSGHEWLTALRAGMHGKPDLMINDWQSWLVDPLGFDPTSTAVPVLIYGGDQDQTCPPEHARDLAARLPNARLTVVPDHGHLHTPALLAEVITATLAAAVESPS